MTVWSRYLFGASMIFGVVVMLLADRLPEWWSPVSVVVMMAGAFLFLSCSVAEYRQTRVAASTSE